MHLSRGKDSAMTIENSKYRVHRQVMLAGSARMAASILSCSLSGSIMLMGTCQRRYYGTTPAHVTTSVLCTPRPLMYLCMWLLQSCCDLIVDNRGEASSKNTANVSADGAPQLPQTPRATEDPCIRPRRHNQQQLANGRDVRDQVGLPPLQGKVHRHLQHIGYDPAQP